MLVYQQFAPVASASDTDAPHPNIVFILADDLGYSDLGCYDNPVVRTPNIDHLATEGVRFTQFYANGPECTPTRAALLTGRYQQRFGGLECAIGTGNVGRYDDAIRLRRTHDLGLPASATAIARRVQDVGYATAIVGKWHLGYEDKFAPSRHGFDYSFYCVGGGMDYFHHVEFTTDFLPVLRLNGQRVQRPGYFTDLVADEAAHFIAANRQRPFFLYVPFTAPHAPYQGPNDYLPDPLPTDSPLWNQSKGPRATYTAMVERLDKAVGRILAALKDAHCAEHTLVVFTSDNGGTRSAWPMPLAGYKGQTFEGGIRVPCVVRWPGVLPEGMTTDQVAIMMDLTASIARAAGAKPPSPSQAFDGADVLDWLAHNRPVTPRTLCWRGRRGTSIWKAVRSGDLKYVAHIVGGKMQEEGCYDLAADPGEKINLLAARVDDADQLKQLLVRWEHDVEPK